MTLTLITALEWRGGQTLLETRLSSLEKYPSGMGSRQFRKRVTRANLLLSRSKLYLSRKTYKQCDWLSDFSYIHISFSRQSLSVSTCYLPRTQLHSLSISQHKSTYIFKDGIALEYWKLNYTQGFPSSEI
jgi:hypothetical protein